MDSYQVFVTSLLVEWGRLIPFPPKHKQCLRFSPRRPISLQYTVEYTIIINYSPSIHTLRGSVVRKPVVCLVSPKEENVQASVI